MLQTRFWRTATLAAALALALPAQERRPLLGKVTAPDGAPFAGATVHCALVPDGSTDGVPTDLVVARCDERGRFHADLFACTRYRVWAFGAKRDDGERATSDVTVAHADQVVTLATQTRPAPDVLMVEEHDLWRDRGPLRVRFVASGVCLPDAVMAVGEDGTCPMPPMPGDRWQADVLDQNGALVWSLNLVRNDPPQLRPPELREIPMRVLTTDGEPVAGATVHLMHKAGYGGTNELGVGLGSRTLPIRMGETDEHGELTARVPCGHDPFEAGTWTNLMFLAEKAGFAAANSGFYEFPYHDGQETAAKIVDGGDEPPKPTESARLLRFTLEAHEPWQGRLHHGGEPVAGVALSVRLQLRMQRHSGNSWLNQELVRRVETDADGRFELPLVRGAKDHVQIMISGSPLFERLVPEQSVRTTPTTFCTLHRRDADGFAPVDVDLAALRPVHVRVHDEHGVPASSAVVTIFSDAEQDDHDLDEWTATSRCDRAGRLTLLVERGRWFVFARTETDAAHERFEADGPTEVDLTVQPLASMRGRVVDGDGNAVAGATFDCNGSGWSTPPQRDPALQEIASTCNWHWLDATAIDDEGRFVCRWLSLPGMSYRCVVEKGERKSERFELRADEDATITLR